jgi:hypothetical protein
MRRPFVGRADAVRAAHAEAGFGDVEDLGVDRGRSATLVDGAGTVVVLEVARFGRAGMHGRIAIVAVCTGMTGDAEAVAIGVVAYGERLRRGKGRVDAQQGRRDGNGQRGEGRDRKERTQGRKSHER